MADWKDKIALITGAGTGIGRAVSCELARRGALVYVTALTEAEAQAVVDTIVAEGGRAVAMALDVTDYARFEAALAEVVQQQGRLDLLMNNAGIVYVGEYLEMDEAYLAQLVQINLTAVMMGTLYAYRIMKQQGHGLIANVSSQGGLMPVATMAAYSATKHGVLGLTESVAGEAAAFGVQLQSICPGNVASELLSKAKTRGTSAQGVLDALPPAMPTEDAASYIVDHLGTGKRRIIVTWLARLLAFAVRVWPGFGLVGARASMKNFRANRDDANNQL